MKKKIERPIRLDLTVDEAKTLNTLLLMAPPCPGEGQTIRWIKYRLEGALLATVESP